MMAIRTKEAWIREQFAEVDGLLPEVLFDRNRFSYSTLMVGLRFFSAVASSLDLKLEADLDELQQALLGRLEATGESLVKTKSWSEVDIFLTTIGEMAQLAHQNSGMSPMLPGRNFVASLATGELILDLRVIYPMYQRQMAITHGNVVFTSLQQLEPLLKSERYFVTNERVVQGMGGGRKLWVLSLNEMRAKGHEIGMFLP
jgi:hypothetical protein